MARLLFQLFGARWLKAAFVYLFWWVSVGLQPWLMGGFTDYLAARPESALPGLAYSLGLCACGVGYTLTIQHKFTLLQHIVTDLRTLLMTLLCKSRDSINASAARWNAAFSWTERCLDRSQVAAARHCSGEFR